MRESWQVQDELTTDLEGITSVTVRIVAGDVAVTTGEAPSRLEVRRHGGPPVEVSVHDGHLEIAHPKPASLLHSLIDMIGSSRHRCSVSVIVPPEATSEVTTVSAPVVVSGLQARTKVKTVSGDVTLSDLADHVDVKTVSGDVESRGIAADLKAKTVSGSVTVVDGSCTWVDAKTVSGEVILDLELRAEGVYEIATVSGPVAVRTEVQPNVLVEATSVSGEIITDFGLGWEDDRPGRRTLRERIGDATARLVLKTVSGDMRLLRRREAA